MQTPEQNRASSRKYRDNNLERCREHSRRYQRENREVIAARKKIERKRLIARIRELKSKPCQDCGQSFPPCCMDFDHRPGEKKLEKLRARTVNGNWRPPRSMTNLILSNPAAFEREVLKCDLVCSNCHRIRTQERKYHKQPREEASEDVVEQLRLFRFGD
jgi:hypothetical protein